MPVSWLQVAMTVGLGAAEAQGQDRQCDRDEIPRTGDEGETGEAQGDRCHDQREPAARPATPKGSGDDDHGGSPADEPPDRTGDDLGPVVDHEPDHRARRGAEHDGGDPAERRRGEQPCEEHTERRAEPECEADRVPVPHRRSV